MSSRFRRSVSRASQFVRRHRAGLAISLAMCVCSLVLYGLLYVVPRPTFPRLAPVLDLLDDTELKTLDTRMLLRGPRPPNPALAIVTIDEKSQNELGRWPFSRDKDALLVDALHRAGAKVITFDVAFPRHDDSTLKYVERISKAYDRGAAPNPSFAAQLKTWQREANHDLQFSDALSHFDNAILGYFFFFTPAEMLQARTQNPAELADFENYLSFQAYPQVVHPEYGTNLFNCAYCQAVGLEPTLPLLARNAKNFGFFNVVADPDGVVRRDPAVIRFHGSYYPSLDVATVLAYLNRPLDQVAVVFNSGGLERIGLGPFTIPTNPQGYVQIDFHGPRNTYPWVSFSDVVDDRPDVSVNRVIDGQQRQFRISKREAFGGKIVLVGATATALADNRSTPFETNGTFPGVEVHANCIDNMLNGEFIRRGLNENLIDILFILLFSLGAGILLSVVTPIRATAVLLIFLGLFLWLAFDLFASHRIWIVAFLPTATLTTNYSAIISYRFFFEEREKKKVRGAFQQYLAPGLISQLLDNPELLQLGGEEKELSVMFTDIRGFTAISEGLSPVQLVELLNEYLSEMTEIIFRNWGTLDKYIGDAIMAFWGAPYPQPDHAERSCRTALEMLDALKLLRVKLEAAGRPPIDIGVGINSGPVLIGNMGSKRRFNYSILGDNVNLASRLEGLNKAFRTRLIISELTFEKVREKFVARELDFIRVKGKKKPVRIYELLSDLEQYEQHRDLVERFTKALEQYRGGQWAKAVEMFEGLRRDYPQDGPSAVLLERCQGYLAEPPPGVWDGVHVMKTK
jgi:adenylate cyclase